MSCNSIFEGAILLCAIVSFKLADPCHAGDPANDSLVVSNAGNLWTAQSNFGTWGDPNQTLPSWRWPGGEGGDYLWEGRLWVGARLAGIPYVTQAEYGNYEWHSAYDDPLSLGPGWSDQDFVAYYDDEYQQTGHFPLHLRVEERTLGWDDPQYTDFIGVELRIINIGNYFLDSVYVGFNFDHDVFSLDPTDPGIDDWVDYDGEDGVESQSDRRDWADPMDLDGDGQTGYDSWGWPWADLLNPQYNPASAEPDGIYDEYYFWEDPSGPQILAQPGTIFEGQPLTDAAGNPLHGWLLPRGVSYMFDGNDPSTPENDTGERQLAVQATGFCGLALLYCPTDSTVNPWSHQWWNWNSDPGYDEDRYSRMEGTSPSSMGYRYMPRPYDIGAPPFDYRYLLSCGPYTLSPQDTLTFALAQCIGLGLRGLRATADQAMRLYYSGSLGSPTNPTGPYADLHWDTTATAVVEPPAAVPLGFHLNPSHPNPFNATTVLRFDLPVASFVKLEVFDIQGQRVGVGLVPTLQYPAGTHQITFDGSDLPSGIYLARLQAGDFSQTQKLVLLK